MSESESEFTPDEPYSMTEEELAARLHRKHTGRIITQLYAVTTLSIGAVCFGITVGSSAPVMRGHAEDVINIKNYISESINFASISYLGMTFGSFILSALALKKGPRKILLITSPIQVIIWLLMTYVKKLEAHIAFLFFSGFLSVGYVTCGRILLKDYVPANTYYLYFTIFKSSQAFGIFLSYVFISGHTALVSGILVSMEFILLFFCPESPVFLYQDLPMKAEAALKFLRGSDNIQRDMRQIKKDCELRSFDVSVKYMLFAKVVYKAIFINLGLFFFKTLTGYYIFIAFSLCLLDAKENPLELKDYFGKYADSIIMGCTYFISRTVCTFLHFWYNFGTKKPLIISLALVSVCLFLFSINLFLTQLKIRFFLKYNWSKIIILILHTISYEMGVNIIPEFLLFDYLPSQVYQLVYLTLECFHWFNVYILIRFILHFSQKYFTNAGTCLVAGFGCFCGCFFCWKFVVESKGKPLLQIQQELGGNPIGSRSTYTARHPGNVRNNVY